MKNNNIIFLTVSAIIILILIIISVYASGRESRSNYKEDLLGINYDVDGNETSLDEYKTDNPVVAMYIEKYGSIVMELYPDVAPNTVNNFISLVRSGFYDNNNFHRLAKDFVLQGGDPEGTGIGGPGYSIKGEFSDNGYENNLSHTKGVVSMARSQDNDSAGSQFFIVLEDATSLNGAYASFGKVIDGWDNIEAIEKQEAVSDLSSGKLRNNLTIKKALIDLKGKEYNDVEKVSD